MEVPSGAEFIAVLLARELKNDWKGVTPRAPIIAAACLLARRLHAPGLWFWTGSLGVNPEPDRLYASGTDMRYLASVEAMIDFYDIFEYGETGCDFMFYSGMQIDRRGNCNNRMSGGPGTGRPLRLGAGQANTSHPVVDDHIFLFAPNHTPEVFVERVDFVSVAGYLDGPDDRRRLGLPGPGPELCVTNLAVLDFDPTEKVMRIKSVHPGHTVEDVRSQTGFELGAPDRVAETVMPSEEELHVLREIDVDGALRRDGGQTN